MRIYNLQDAVQTLPEGEAFLILEDTQDDYRDQNMVKILRASNVNAHIGNPILFMNNFVASYNPNDVVVHYENNAWYLIHEKDQRELEGNCLNACG